MKPSELAADLAEGLHDALRQAVKTEGNWGKYQVTMFIVQWLLDNNVTLTKIQEKEPANANPGS